MTSDLTPTWAVLADLLDPPTNPYLNDPVGWATDRLGEFIWSKQREIAEALVDHRYVAVKSAHDTGKSHVASRVVAWHLDTKPDPFATTTAPTTKQVHAILWRYLGQAHRKAKLDGRITLDDEWYMGPGGKELVAYGRKPADTDQAAFQGIHALNPFILVDEACGVPRSIFDAVDALATNTNARVLAIGNPDDPSSHFAQICKPGSGWYVIAVSAFDTPAFTGEEVPVELLPLLVSPEWVEERKKRWGVTSPIYQSKVLGEFPDISDDSLIHPKWIEAAQKRTIERSWKPRLGVDIARYGEDETVLYRREGGWVRLHRAHSKTDTMVTTGHIVKARDEINVETPIQAYVEIVVDEVGVGAGVLDRLLELGVDVVGFNGGESPTTGRSVAASSRRHRSAPRSDTFSVFNTAGAPTAAGSCSTPILKLELSREKTLITHARTHAARFLGYDVTVHHDDCKITNGRRTANGVIALRVPAAVVTANCTPYLRGGRPEYQPPLMNLDDHEIVKVYGARYRGLVQYYLLAGDVWKLSRLHWVMLTSMLKTLAAKHHSSVSTMARKHRATLATPHGPRRCFQVTVDENGRKPLVVRFGGIPLRRQKHAVIDDRPVPVTARRTELIGRLQAGRCELCGSCGAVRVHHVRNLADLAIPGRPQPAWAQLMTARRRKTLVVCPSCHDAIHARQPTATPTQ